MAWDVEFTDQFGEWWDALDEDAQTSINAIVLVLEQLGPALTRPYADTVKGSRHTNMRELRVQHQGHPFRLLYAFDPRRTAIILVGGDKGGDDRWYDVYIPIADKLYDEHMQQIQNEQNPKKVQ
ncbi:MAG: type II toxin-antitoxin system RelE/ParE family toxin [Candidatus Baltobacteraceae bacterium]